MEKNLLGFFKSGWFLTQMFRLQAPPPPNPSTAGWGIYRASWPLWSRTQKTILEGEPSEHLFFSWSPSQLLKRERPMVWREHLVLRTEQWAVTLGLVCGSCLRPPSMPERPHVKFPLSFPLCLHSWPNVYLYLMVPGSSPKLSFFIIFCFLVVHYVLVTTKLKFTFKWNKYGHENKTKKNAYR